VAFDHNMKDDNV